MQYPQPPVEGVALSSFHSLSQWGRGSRPGQPRSWGHLSSTLGGSEARAVASGGITLD